MAFSWSIPCGPPFGIPIRIHLTFFILFVLQLLGSIYYGWEVVVLWAIVLGPILLLTVLIHELGHCFAARSVGGTVQGILLWPLGGLAFIGHNAGPKADMWVAFAGPLTHLPMIGFWVGMLAIASSVAYGSVQLSLANFLYPDTFSQMGVDVCILSIIMNIAMFCFNLFVPAYPLDGGRILVDVLLTAGVSKETTAKITVGVATPIGLGIVVFGCVWFEMVTILVGLFILYATWQLFTHVRDGTIKQHPMFSYTEEGATEGAYWQQAPAAKAQATAQQV